MSVLLLSDLHLDAQQPERTQAFLRWSRSSHARAAAAVYILGDLFEAYLGDDDDDPLMTQVAEALRGLGDGGTTVYFQHGNRDFLLGAEYAARCGITLLPEAHTLELGGCATLLMHGDQLCTQDTGYLRFRQQTRAPEWQQSFLAQDLAARRVFAAHARQESARYTQQAAAQVMDVDPEAVQALFRNYGVGRLIHGHTHRPARHYFHYAGDNKERYVLADWYAGGAAYLRVSGDSFSEHRCV